ncbi:uncharacterized protein LOC128957159 [Oppia nitens]|uniref:uncharacterized protein LOC128957159 n=1 Tax=Oppia nitens TaxID=1686743 RepID=UPI0023DB62D2|nr:uncharacterized protein LOC128957159 [Oppia nitens]
MKANNEINFSIDSDKFLEDEFLCSVSDIEKSIPSPSSNRVKITKKIETVDLIPQFGNKSDKQNYTFKFMDCLKFQCSFNLIDKQLLTINFNLNGEAFYTYDTKNKTGKQTLDKYHSKNSIQLLEKPEQLINDKLEIVLNNSTESAKVSPKFNNQIPSDTES